MKHINLEELITMMDGYAEGTIHQDTPIIVWIDNLDRDLLRLSPEGDLIGFASSFESKHSTASYTYEPGSPLTDKVHILTQRGKVAISDEERRTFTTSDHIIKYDEDGKRITQLYIHSPFSCRIGEKGLTSIEYGLLLHKKLGIAVVLMYPMEWKERLNIDAIGYNQFHCHDTKENQLRLWFEDAESQTEYGLQVVDNFYLDFLKQSPPEYICWTFDKYPSGATFSSYNRWERVSSAIFRSLHYLFFGWKQGSEKSHRLIYSFFKNGNLDFDNLNKALQLISDDNWSRWLNDFSSVKSIEPNYNQLSRVETIKCHLCENIRHENISTEISKALWNYHKPKSDI